MRGDDLDPRPALVMIPVLVQPRPLPLDRERGFRRITKTAHTGAFGRDVVNANIGMDGSAVHVEVSRYSDVDGGEGTMPADEIDEASDASPLQDAGCVNQLEASAQPSVASKPGTIAVTFGMGAASAGGLLFLWGCTPPHPPGRFGA